MEGYGIELECFGLTGDEIEAAIIEAGGMYSRNPHSSNGIYGHGCSPFRDSRVDGLLWAAEWDGTIENTAGRGECHEIISPILYGQEGLDHMKRVCKALVRAGAQVNASCGTHVTIGIETAFSRYRRFGVNKKARAIARIVEAYDYFQAGFNALVSPSRRNGHWCPDVHFGAYTDGVNRYGQGADTHNRGIMNYGAGRGVVHIKSRGKCIEFRQHNGTLNGNKLKNFASLVHRLCSWAINDNHANFNCDMRCFPPTFSGLMAFLNVGSDLTLALEQRVNQLIRAGSGVMRLGVAASHMDAQEHYIVEHSPMIVRGGAEEES